MSNISTPCLIALIMIDFEAWNALFRSSDQRKGVFGLKNGLKVSLYNGIEQFFTWLTKPNQDRTSVVDVGVGKSRIVSRYFGSGSIVALDMRNPAKYLRYVVRT